MEAACAFAASSGRSYWRGQTITPTNAYLIRRFGEDAVCLDEADLKHLLRHPVKKMHVQMGKEVMLRKMTLALTPAHRWVYADRKTGTLYDAITGECKTSDVLRIRPGDLL